jgi:hypothetical protein
MAALVTAAVATNSITRNSSSSSECGKRKPEKLKALKTLL